MDGGARRVHAAQETIGARVETRFFSRFDFQTFNSRLLTAFRYS
jgi:hypothetical protein